MRRMRALAIGAALLLLAASLSGGAGASKARHDPCAAYGSAVWSPDGRQVAWSSGWVDHGVVCVANVDGSHLRRFSTLFEPADQIAWPLPHTLFALPTGELLSVDTRTGKTSRVVEAQDFAVAGGTIAADYCVPEGAPAPIEVIALPSLRRLEIGGKKLESCVFSVSPDGRWVTFTRVTASGAGTAPGTGYWIARTNGTRLRRLAAPGPWLSFFWTSAGLWQGRPAANGERYSLVFPRRSGRSILVPTRQGVRPSPNGRWLAYDTVNVSKGKTSASYTLHLFDVKTHRVRTLEPRHSFFSAWSPDSKQILVGVFDRRTHCGSYWRVPVPTGRPRLVHGC